MKVKQNISQFKGFVFRLEVEFWEPKDGERKSYTRIRETT